MPSNLQPTRDLIADWRPDDAGKLAQLFNEIGPAWPGGMGERAITAQEAEREFRSRAGLAAFVAEAGGRFVALCDLHEGWDKPHNAYVGFLTAHPDYHGKGFGKAVLLACVEKAFQLGYPRVDLGTWAGNTKAVPLYKKAGFMWVPNGHPQGVHMQNFTPFARRHPLAREFFAENDWYETLKRDYALKEDVFRRGKVKVFRYEWRSPDGRLLRMVFDRQSWGLLEIETNEFRAGCFLPDEKLVCGLRHTMRWEIVNKTARPLKARLRASADRGVALHFSRTVLVTDRANLQAQFTVDPKLPEKKKPPRVPIITTRLHLDGNPIELKAGFEAEQPISVGLEAPTPSLVPGRAQKVFFHVRSRLGTKSAAQVRLTPAAGASLEPSSAKVTLPAKGAARFAASATSSRSGKVEISWSAQVRIRQPAERMIRPKPDKLALAAAQPLECIGFAHRDFVLLQSASLKISVSRHAQYMKISRRPGSEEEGVGAWVPSVGPPFVWEEFSKERCRARIERAGGEVTAVLESESRQRPGLWLRRRIALGNEPVVRIVDTIHNRSSSAHTLSRRFGGHVRSEGPRPLVAPVKGQMVSAGDASRDPGDLGLHDEAEHWPEGWVAYCSRDGWSAGFLWGKAERIECNSWGCRIETPLGTSAPGEQRTCDPVYLYVGDGDASVVRRWWRLLFAPETKPEEKPQSSEAVRFAVDPDPLIIAGQRRASLRLSAVGKKDLKGNIALALPAGFRPRRVKQKGCGFGAGREFAKQFTVRRQARVREGVYQAELTLDDGDHIYQRAVPVVAVGSGKGLPGQGIVRVAKGKDGLREISNGRLRLKVAPAFSGTAVALEYDGANWLRSSYPKAGPMAWWNPWHGGIWPVLEEPREMLHKYKCRAGVCEREGSSGIRWRGVRLTWDRKKEELGGVFRYQVEYLLAPGSRIVAVAVRCQQRGVFPIRCHAGFDVWPNLGGSHLDAVLHSALDSQAARKRTDSEGMVHGGPWVMAENPKTGHALMLISAADNPVCSANVVGRDGYHLEAHCSGRLEPKQSAETVCYLVISRTPAEAKPWSALAQASRLP